MKRDRMRFYTRLTVAAKQRDHLTSMREPAVRCPHCATETTAADLVTHVEVRCTKQPPTSSRWITWREAKSMGLGVPKQTLSDWVQRGLVRIQPDPQRRYLLRDLATHVAVRKSGPPRRKRR